jgi:hypothetical protein
VWDKPMGKGMVLIGKGNGCRGLSDLKRLRLTYVSFDYFKTKILLNSFIISTCVASQSENNLHLTTVK